MDENVQQDTNMRYQMKWNQEYSVGYDEIDRQHQELGAFLKTHSDEDTTITDRETSDH